MTSVGVQEYKKKHLSNFTKTKSILYEPNSPKIVKKISS